MSFLLSLLFFVKSVAPIGSVWILNDSLHLDCRHVIESSLMRFYIPAGEIIRSLAIENRPVELVVADSKPFKK